MLGIAAQQCPSLSKLVLDYGRSSQCRPDEFDTLTERCLRLHRFEVRVSKWERRAGRSPHDGDFIEDSHIERFASQYPVLEILVLDRSYCERFTLKESWPLSSDDNDRRRVR